MSDKLNNNMTVAQEMEFIQKKSDTLEKQITGYRTLGKRGMAVMCTLAGLFGLFHLWTACAGLYTAMIQRSVHLSFALVICMLKFSANRNLGAKKEPWGPYAFLGIGICTTIFLYFYVNKITASLAVHLSYFIVIAVGLFVARMFTKKKRIAKNEEVEKSIYWYDYCFILMSIISCWYITLNTNTLVMRQGIVTYVDQVCGVWLLLCILEATRRSIGRVLMAIGIAMILYCKFGYLCGGVFWHPGFKVAMIMRHFYLTDVGIWSTPIGVSSTYIAMFLLFGAALHATGLAELLLKIAKGVFGSMVGGPAKMAVVASSMFAMLSGSSTSNVATTGVITIPLMKRTGIPASLAGAVEAASSLGGQITPPVMGSAAFIMAEYLGVSYLSIVVAAALPAALYYVSVFTMIHFESHKIGAIGLPKSELPPWKGEAARKCYLFLPVIILVTLLILGFSALYAPFAAFIAAIVLSMFDKKTRLTPKKFFDVLSNAGQTLTVVAIPCAAAGFVVGTAGLTGLTPALTSLLTTLSQNNFVLTLVLTMLLCLLLGMGVPTTANYILMTIMTVPIMVKVGVMPLAAHLFCFYFGIMSELTPPVAITSYTASAIAGAPFWPTAFNAVRLAAVAYIVPYIFVFNTSLLLGTQKFTAGVFLVVVTACIGALSFSIGMAGFIRRKMFLWERFLICIGACLAIKPGTLTDILGIGIIGFVFAMQWLYKKNPKNYKKVIGA
ncbi:MAG: TRAP transporter fused permease subunit [Spirochaetia bacterium]|nr:TRAP transporter fused permease subunit [Spirochaetia bacterium]